MAYTKKTWVKGNTPLSAENFNHMEQGIADAHTDIAQLNSELLHYSQINFSNLEIQPNTDKFIGIDIPSGYTLVSALASITGEYHSWVIDHLDTETNWYYFHNTSSVTIKLSGIITLLLKKNQ
jgi:hypothetical protein